MRLRVVGLRDQHDIERYRDAWCSQRLAPTLGGTVDLDGLPLWPPERMKEF